MNSGKVLLGLLAGVAAGAVVGILFAPDKGTSTRKKIAKKSNDYVDGLGDQFNDFIEMVTERFESVVSEATRMAEQGKQKAEDGVRKVEDSMHKTHDGVFKAAKV